MDHLVCNGTHLYRRSSHLVRTPISGRKLKLVETAYYCVADQYSSSQLPLRGFVCPNDVTSITAAGNNVRQEFLNPTRALQIWRKTSTPRTTVGTVFYQGAYATSAPNPSVSGEAYMGLAGYKFEVPDPDHLKLDNVKITYTLGGLVTGFGNTGRAKGWAGADVWVMCVCVTDSLRKPSQILANSAYVNEDMIARTSSSTAGYTGVYDYWGPIWPSGTRGDGGVRCLSGSPSVTLNATTSMVTKMNQLGEFWVIPHINATTSRPYFVGNAGEWGCFSVWNIQVTADLVAI